MAFRSNWEFFAQDLIRRRVAEGAQVKPSCLDEEEEQVSEDAHVIRCVKLKPSLTHDRSRFVLR